MGYRLPSRVGHCFLLTAVVSLVACTADKSGTRCTTIGDCPAGEQCLNHQCEKLALCLSDTDCPAGEVCNGGVCQTPTASCEATGTCSSDGPDASDQGSPDAGPSNSGDAGRTGPDAGSMTETDAGPPGEPDSGPMLDMDGGPLTSPDSGSPPIDAGSSEVDSGPTVQVDAGPSPEPDSGPVTEPDAGSTLDAGTGCTSNAECRNSPTPVCLRSTGQCVQCTSNSNCGSDETCSQSHTCVPAPVDAGPPDAGPTSRDAGTAFDAGLPFVDAGTPPVDAGPPPVDAGSPAGCTTNADCSATPASPLCDTATGTCIQCSPSSGCSTGVCASGICTNGPGIDNGTACTSDSECADNSAGPYCVTATGLCVQCDDAHPCPATEWCEVGVCAPGPSESCGNSSSCSASASQQTCDTRAGLCVQCTQSCPGSEVCSNDGCIAAPCTSSSCSGGLVCNGSNDVCVHCQVDGDCNSASDFCFNGTCASKVTPGVLGCAAVEQCEEGCFDDTGVCMGHCDAAATMLGAELYNALSQCTYVACPDLNPGCVADVQSPGGSCWAQTVACQQDG